MSLAYRDGRPGDGGAIADLFRTSFVATFGHLYSDEDLETFLAAVTGQAFEAELAGPRFSLRLAEEDGALAGFAHVREFVRHRPQRGELQRREDGVQRGDAAVDDLDGGQDVGARAEDVGDAEPRTAQRVREDEGAAVDRRAHSGTSHTVIGSTSVSSISSARATMRRLSVASIPTGCVIAGPCTTRFAPIIVAMVGSAVTNAVAIPARSISFASTAPQRVPVPQVPESSTAWTPASLSSEAISPPKRVELATGVPFPVVV